jgi:hypothetical protein
MSLTTDDESLLICGYVHYSVVYPVLGTSIFLGWCPGIGVCVPCLETWTKLKYPETETGMIVYLLVLGMQEVFVLRVSAPGVLLIIRSEHCITGYQKVERFCIRNSNSYASLRGHIKRLYLVVGKLSNRHFKPFIFKLNLKNMRRDQVSQADSSADSHIVDLNSYASHGFYCVHEFVFDS